MATSKSAKAKAAPKKAKKAKPRPKVIDTEDKEFQAMVKQFDANTGRQLLEVQQSQNVYSSGCLGLDCATGRRDPKYGNGGFAARNPVEFFGAPGVFKSGTLDFLIKSVQDRGLYPVVLFSEEPPYERMVKHGINIDRLIILDCYEPLMDEECKLQDEKFRLAERRLLDLINASKNPKVGLVGIDSLKGLTSGSQIYAKGDGNKRKERDFADRETAVRANLMEKYHDRLKIHNVRALPVIINQFNERIDMNKYGGGFDRDTPTSGGARKEFEAIIRVGVRSVQLKENESHDVFGHKPVHGLKITYVIKKNRWGHPGRRVVARYDFAECRYRISEEVIKYGHYLGLIARRGNFYEFPGVDSKFNGIDRATKFLDENPEIVEALTREIIPRSDELFSLRKTREIKHKDVFDDGERLVVSDEDDDGDDLEFEDEDDAA